MWIATHAGLVAVTALFVFLGALGIWLRLRRNARRARAWQRMAADTGLAYFGRGTNIQTRFGHLPFFRGRRGVRIEAGIRGTLDGLQVTLANIREPSSDDGEDSRYTACFVSSQALELPACVLRFTTALDLVGGLFRGQDICFEDDPEFARWYVLTGPEEGAIRSLFDSRRRAWFKGRRRTGLFHFEAQGDTFLFHRATLCESGEVRDMLGEARTLLHLLSGPAKG